MTKLLVFANCQANPVASLIGILSPEVEIVRCPAVHTIANERRIEIIDLIGGSDIIVHQPIGQNFGPIASDALRAMFPQKTFISFPSIYFGGLFPQLAILREPSGRLLRGFLRDYHDLRILESFLRGETRTQCADRLTSDAESYAAIYRACMQESLSRESGTDIKVMPTVVEAIRERPCLHTFNHPDNLLLYHVAEQAVKKLGLPANPTAKAPQIPMLADVSAAVPRGLTRHLGVDWRRDEYSFLGRPVPNEELIDAFFGDYASHPDIKAVAQHNCKRFNLDIKIPG